MCLFLACDESCESTCSDGTNTGCDSCKDGYTQNEDQACVGKYLIFSVFHYENVVMFALNVQIFVRRILINLKLKTLIFGSPYFAKTNPRKMEIFWAH